MCIQIFIKWCLRVILWTKQGFSLQMFTDMCKHYFAPTFCTNFINFIAEQVFIIALFHVLCVNKNDLSFVVK